MAEEQEETTGESKDAAPKKGSKKLLIIIGSVLVLALAIGIPTAMMLMKKEPAKTDELDANAAQEEAHATLEGSDDEEELGEDEEPLGAIVPFDTFLVNLAGGKYIRVQIQVEFATLDIPRRFYSRMVPIRDSIISILTQQSPDDLQTQKGKEKLRDQIKSSMNDALRKEDVKRVYFTQFVIQ